MISLIVCSKNPYYFEQFVKSVINTVGEDFEIIKIDNLVEKLSIAQAYNKGASRAKFSILVFVHEDVIFHTHNWGKLLIEYFKKLYNPGVLGIAGASYLPISPSDWWISDKRYLNMNFISNTKSGKVGEGKLKSTKVQEPIKVFALDGMFLSAEKSVWKEFQFDESLDGFHGYDTSICYRISQKFQNYFIPCILIEHFSKGYPNHTWLKNTIRSNRSIIYFILSKKTNNLIDKRVEIKVYHLFLEQLIKYGNNYLFVLRNSSFYLLKLNSCFFSGKSFLLWSYFQFVYFRKR